MKPVAQLLQPLQAPNSATKCDLYQIQEEVVTDWQVANGNRLGSELIETFCVF